MKREEILKRAASLFTNEVAKNVFIEGAQWRIDSVWHGAGRTPEDGRALLAVTEDGRPLIAGPDNGEWEDSARELDIVRWAYTDDLMPDVSGGMTEADRDVPERTNGDWD